MTGKALDLIVQRFGVSHAASVSFPSAMETLIHPGQTLYLKQSSTEAGSHVLQNNLELSGQLEDGSTVVLTDSGSNE